MQRYRLSAWLVAACLLCCCPSACAEAQAGIEPEPFDCRAGLENWRTGWSPEKKSWCCQSHNLGCRALQEEELAEPSLANEAGADANATGAAVESSAPQVQRYGPGHCVSTWKTEANHCMVRTDCARQDISRYPIAILCVDSAGGRVRHVFGKDSFAPEETFDTLIICEECRADTGPQGRIGDTRALNATLQAFVREVNEIKQKALTARIEVHSLNSIVHKVYHRRPDMSQVPDLFHCDVGRANWKAGWSKEKKCWCCSMKNVGCEPENVGCVPEVPVVLPETPPAPPFDCAAGVGNHKLGWSKAKKCWCCETSSIGCDAEIQCGQDEPAVAVEPPRPRFECKAGLQNYELGWSDRKKIWCCRAHGLGCATKNATRSPQLFNCAAGLEHAEAGWSEEKKKWCCARKNVGCRLDPYDCRLDFGSRETDWTPAKKYWCCQKFGMGCPPEDAQYDCMTGLHDPDRLWSLQKRRWCCSTAKIGCSTWAEVKSEVRRPRRARRRRAAAVVSQGGRASFPHFNFASSAASQSSEGPIALPAAARRRAAAGARRVSSSTTTFAAAPTTAPPPAALTEEAWKLDVESEARMRQVGRLRQLYLRATSSELAAIAPFRAKAAAAAEEAAEADEVGRLGTWSGPSETDDEIAAQAASRRLQQATEVQMPTAPPPRRRPQHMLRRAALNEEPQEAMVAVASQPADDGEWLDDSNSAAALVESYAQGAWDATAAVTALPPREARRTRRTAKVAPQSDAGQAADLWWDDSEDLAFGATSLGLDVGARQQEDGDEQVWIPVTAA